MIAFVFIVANSCLSFCPQGYPGLPGSPGDVGLQGAPVGFKGHLRLRVTVTFQSRNALQVNKAFPEIVSRDRRAKQKVVLSVTHAIIALRYRIFI